MRKIEDLQEYESEKIVYIIEKKINEASKNDYIKSMKNLKDTDVISEKRYKDLIERFNKRWICESALSYSEDYDEILKEFIRDVKNYPCIETRIIKAKCVCHKFYGISSVDYDYDRIKILPMLRQLSLLVKIQKLLHIRKKICNSSNYLTNKKQSKATFR